MPVMSLLLALLAMAPTRPRPNPQDSLMAPGVARSLAASRRSRISDLRYDLSLDVTRADTAAGRVTTRFTLTGQGDLIVDFRGLRIRRLRVNGLVLSEPEFNGHHVRVPASAVVVGANRLDIDFDARIAPAGAGIIRVNDPADGATYLYTLLVPSDAQLLFPVFDQPDLKARLTLRLTTPREWTAVANGARVAADTSGRKVTHTFAESSPISTYLMAFAAGPWATRSWGGSSRPITLYVRRSRATEVDADSIIADNDRGLRWLERYFASRYPFGKLDVVLAPAFPFGGMEHPGAIFYSEERFIFREPPTLSQRLSRTATIYHEVAHQWFGDLVTMEWFDDLWLKEGFSTYMAARMQAAMDPGSDAWKTFYLRNKPPAYAVDATEGTTPVWQALDNLDQAKSAYGAIVYNKAPSVLKQLNHLVGDDAFQGGLQRFLRRHAFANATWRDLLASIAEAWGRPLDAWGASYILRPGLPVIEQHVDVREGKIARLALVQRPAGAVSGRGAWPIGTVLSLAFADGAVTRIPVTLAEDTTIVETAAGRPAPAWVFANAGDQAYGLVLLDSLSVAWLEGGIGSVRPGLDRAMLWGALWDLVRESAFAPDRYVRMVLRELPRERDEQLVPVLLGRLTRALGGYLGDRDRAEWLPKAEQGLYAVAVDSAAPYGVRRAHLDALIRVAATAAAIDTLEALLDRPALSGLPIGAPTRWSIVSRLVAAGARTADRRLREEEARDRTPEGARRAFAARAARPDTAVKREYFTRWFADTQLNEDWATASLDAFNAPESRVLVLPYLRPALDSLRWIQQNRRIFYLGSWLGAFLDAQVSPAALDVVRRFLLETPTLGADLRGKVLQASDELRRTVSIRARFGR